MKIALLDYFESNAVVLKKILLFMYPKRKLDIDIYLDPVSFLKTNYHLYDMIITDNKMEKITGIELINKIEGENYKGKIVLITGYHDIKPNYEIKHKVIYKPVNRYDIENIF